MITNGLGRAVATRALQDPEFRALVAETEIGDIGAFGKLAFAHVNVELSWTATVDKAVAVALEDRLLAEHDKLWNRRPGRATKAVKLVES